MDSSTYRASIIGILTASTGQPMDDDALDSVSAALEVEYTLVSETVPLSDPGEEEAVRALLGRVEERAEQQVTAAFEAGVEVATWLLGHVVALSGRPAAEVLRKMALELPGMFEDGDGEG